MFTGIIEGVGKVMTIRRGRDDMSLTIMPAFEMTDLRVGESVSVDGVCLTVTEISSGAFRADVSGETLSRSTLNMLRQGDEVNLERALRMMDRLGGHLVSGHVDGIGKILKKEHQQRSWFLRIGIDQQVSRYTIEKGSIAVDGISLTINRCGGGFFEVNVIPLTGIETTILKKSAGDPVNIETDLIGKYIEKFFLNKMSIQESGKNPVIDLEMLIKSGFGE